MTLRIVFVCLVLCVVLAKTKDCEDQSVKDCCGDAEQNSTEIKRFKRAKYYPSPPPGAIKYYRRPPPYGFPQRISYTPPPNYVREEDDMPYPPRPPHGRTTNEGLGAEDINNIVKYLSKQDLDKIIEFASEKERETPSYKKTRAPKESDDYEYARQQFNENINNIQPQSYGPADEKFSLNGPFVSASYSNDRPYQSGNNPNSNLVQDANQPKAAYVNAPQNVFFNVPLDTQESMQHEKVAYLNGPYAGHVNGGLSMNVPNSKQNDDSSGNKDTNEELLPKPVNLREEIDNIEGAFTRNVASVAAAESGYKVENLGNLPVMDYHSKLFQTNSYNVPHYFITSNPKSPASTPPVEPAPPPQSARDQSDAHLKAIKIWSHRSRGQAYTLQDDGTLSVERPLRPRTKYGYP